MVPIDNAAKRLVERSAFKGVADLRVLPLLLASHRDELREVRDETPDVGLGLAAAPDWNGPTGVIRDPAGDVYRTTSAGGALNGGMVYSLNFNMKSFAAVLLAVTALMQA